MTETISHSSGGVDFSVELERRTLLPGRSAKGSVTLVSAAGRQVRGCIAALIGTEQWQYRETRRDSRGNTSTVTRTARDEVQRLPVRLLGPTTLAAGEPTTLPFEVPVPPLGPATVDATVARMEWRLEVKLDVGGIDPSIDVPLVVLQPTSLLAAGVVRVGQFALFESAETADGGMQARITLQPMPLVIGAPFRGAIELGGSPPSRLQEIRLELKVKVQATVATGLSESVTLWSAVLPPSAVGAIPLEGVLGSVYLPTAQLPHGRTEAVFDIVLARKLAGDDHLVRDVVVASTAEL